MRTQPDGVRAFSATDVGRIREHNEDTYLVDGALGLALVADGMGGHAAGEVASRLASESFAEHLRSRTDVLAARARGECHDRDVHALVAGAMMAACAEVFEAASSNSERTGMGTTCTAAVFVGDRLFGSHVGDSRMLLIRDGEAVQLSRDHSVLAQLVAMGRLTADEARGAAYSGYRNALARAVGVTPQVEVDTFCVEIAPGDVVVLCSDGLTAYVSPEEMATAVIADIEGAPDHLVAMANERGGHDNITVVVAEVPADRTGDARRVHLAEKAAAVTRVPMFAILEGAPVLEIAALADVVTLDGGECVVGPHLRTDADALFVVLDGEVEVREPGRGTRTVRADGHFGEIPVAQSQPTEYEARATSASRLMRVRRNELAEFLPRSPNVGLQLLWSFAQFAAGRERDSSRAESAQAE